MIGCQANQPNTKAVLAELREGMWQNELETLMRSSGVVLIGTRNLGAGAAGQARDYRFGDKVLRVSLYYPVIRPNEEWRPERYVSDWEFVDLEAEQRREKEHEEWVKKEHEEWLKMDPAARRRASEERARQDLELSRQAEAEMRKSFSSWLELVV